MGVREISIAYDLQAAARDATSLGYKQTEVGMIPIDWHVIPLGALGRFSKGQGVRKDEARSGDIPCIRYGEIYTHHHDIVRKFNSRISEVVAKSSKRLRQGDLLFAGSGETKAEIGKCVAYVGNDEAYAGGDIVILSPEDSSALFLAYLLNAPVINRQKAAKGQGDAVVHISASALSSISVALPRSQMEQDRIAEALSDADALIESLQQLIAKKRQIKQGAMQALLTGQQRLPGLSGAWMSSTLKYSAEIVAGINKPLSSMGRGTLYVTVQDLYGETSVLTGQLGRISVSPQEVGAKSLAAGDIIFGKSSVKREGIGYPSYFGGCKEPVVFTGFAYRARARHKVADPKYLFYVLRMESTRQWLIDNAQSSALTNINKSIADAIPILLPEVNEQVAIASVLTDMDAEITALETRLSKTREIKQGMMQALLTGAIRLPAETA